MDGLPASLSQSLILFLLLAVGFVARKTRVLGDESIRGLSRFILDFSLPALVLISMQKPFTADVRDQALRVLGMSALAYALSFPLAYLVTAAYKGTDSKRVGVHRFALCFSNVGFMGFPVAESILGPESLFMVAVYNIPFQILAFSVGAALIRGPSPRPPSPAKGSGGRFLRVLKPFMNPAVASALLGFALFLLSARIPEPVYGALDILGHTTTPLAMAVIGAVLGGTSLRGVLSDWRLWVTSGWRLAVHPLLIYVFARALGLSGIELAVPVLITAMPVAANTTILAGVYGGDTVSASALVFVSTVLSLASIPALGFLLGL